MSDKTTQPMKSLLRNPLKDGERLVCYCPPDVCQAPKGFSGPCNRAADNVPDDAFMQDIESMSRETLIQMVHYYQAQDGLLTKAQDEAKKLREELAEVKRPLDDQMARLNKRVIELNEQLAKANASPAIVGAVNAR